ncbi:putative transposase of IS4/5 family DUF4096 [Loktanella sp. PT4BL]|jgi:hypothetical protein|nr:putative transposase of IS4/5 family DUF4096 [Loktanella sp. PT4BL]
MTSASKPLLNIGSLNTFFTCNLCLEFIKSACLFRADDATLQNPLSALRGPSPERSKRPLSALRDGCRFRRMRTLVDQKKWSLWTKSSRSRRLTVLWGNSVSMGAALVDPCRLSSLWTRPIQQSQAQTVLSLELRVGDRRVLSGIIFFNRNGLRWSETPAEYGPPETLYNRWKRWSDMGVFARIMTGLAAPKPQFQQRSILIS